MNIYQGILTQKLNALPDYDDQIKKASKEEDKKKLRQKEEQQDEETAGYSQAMDEVSQSWNAFQNQAADMIRMITDAGRQCQSQQSSFGAV